jgi:hypothetical protein
MLVQDSRMMGELVAAFQNGLDGLRIALDAPGRHEEGLPDAEPAYKLSVMRGIATFGP